MRAFVTGGTGFIGRRLIRRLLADGVEVVALSRPGSSGLPRGASAIRGDLCDPRPWEQVLQDCDRLYHLAALITFDPKRRDELMEINAVGTQKVLEAAGRGSVKRAVIASSACTLGTSRTEHQLLDECGIPCREEVRGNPYLSSKLRAELIARAATRSRPVVIVNPTTVYGPGDRTLNSGTLIRSVARSGFLPVPPGGSNVVDVDDVVDGVLLAAERGIGGRRYILGGENLRFDAIMEGIAAVVGNRPRLLPVPSFMRIPFRWTMRAAKSFNTGRFLTPQVLSDLFRFKFYDTRRARDELDWRPRFTFRQSVERAWSYYQKEGLI